MKEKKKYRSFKDFWPFYVSQHLNPKNRFVHFLGTTLVIALLALGGFSAGTPSLYIGGIVAVAVFTTIYRLAEPLSGEKIFLVGSFVYMGLAAWLVWWAIVGALVAGYGLAWFGHFFFEKNKPATFTYPLWSLYGDFKMYVMTLTGIMGREVNYVRSERFFKHPTKIN